MAAKAYVGHHIDTRTRLYFPEERQNLSLFSLIEKKLGEYSGIDRVQANPLTGSVLILHDGDLPKLFEYARLNDLFEIDEALREYKNWAEDLLGKLNRVDQRIIKATDGEMNLASVVALGLLGAGAYQLSRKQFFPAASTLIADSMRVLVQTYRSSSIKERKNSANAENLSEVDHLVKQQRI